MHKAYSPASLAQVRLKLRSSRRVRWSLLESGLFSLSNIPDAVSYGTTVSTSGLPFGNLSLLSGASLKVAFPCTISVKNNLGIWKIKVIWNVIKRVSLMHRKDAMKQLSLLFQKGSVLFMLCRSSWSCISSGLQPMQPKPNCSLFL